MTAGRKLATLNSRLSFHGPGDIFFSYSLVPKIRTSGHRPRKAQQKNSLHLFFLSRMYVFTCPRETYEQEGKSEREGGRTRNGKEKKNKGEFSLFLVLFNIDAPDLLSHLLSFSYFSFYYLTISLLPSSFYFYCYFFIATINFSFNFFYIYEPDN